MNDGKRPCGAGRFVASKKTQDVPRRLQDDPKQSKTVLKDSCQKEVNFDKQNDLAKTFPKLVSLAHAQPFRLTETAGTDYP